MLEPTADSLRLRSLATRIVADLDREGPPRAILLTGSAGEGIADELSDLDLIAIYDEVPATDHPLSSWIDGVECQVGRSAVARVEETIALAEAGTEPDSPSVHKVASGILHALVIRDGGLVAGWRERLAVLPPPLAKSMAAHHLGLFPYWLVARQLAARDARLFEVQSLLDGAMHVLGALSAANGLYFTTFQFKRMRAHIASMRIAPPDLAARLESLFDRDPESAAEELKALVAETVAIVESELPEVDTTRVRQLLDRRR